jgi:hypothetical protein
MKRVIAWCFAAGMMLAASAVSATFHLFAIEQVFSNADGTVQFVVLRSPVNGEHLWAGQRLTAVGPGGVQTAYKFPTNLPNSGTAGKRVLIATQGFAALGLVTPDYVIPDRFIPIPSGSVDFAGVSSALYSALPTDGVSAIDVRGRVIPNVATNFAGQSASVVSTPGAAANYGGIWWKSPGGSESGWGINFAHQGDIIFATWYTYDANGKAWWLTLIASKNPQGAYTGTINAYRGPAFSATPFDPKLVTTTAVGTGTLTFSDVNNGSFSYTVNGVTQTKAITKSVFASPVPTCAYSAQANLAAAANYQDIWWAKPAGSESGWGVNFTHQGDLIYATWFTYDIDGSPLWLSAVVGKTSPGVYTGTIQRYRGPAFSAVPFLPANVVPTDVGTLTLTFANGNSGTFAYTLNLGGPGSTVTQSKPIERSVFASSGGTVCQ